MRSGEGQLQIRGKGHLSQVPCALDTQAGQGTKGQEGGKSGRGCGAVRVTSLIYS